MLSKRSLAEVPFAATPGLMFAKRFCVKCLSKKKAAGGRVLQRRFFVCVECSAKKADEA